MKKLKLTTCKICGEEKSSRGFSFHISQTHNMKIEDYILKYEFNNIHPLCKCGCGEKVTIRGYEIMDYKNSHSPAGRFNKEKCLKRGESWRKNLAEGIRKWNKEQKEKNPNYRKGKNNNFYGRTVSEETKEKLRNAVKKQIKDGRHPFIGKSLNRVKRSSLEIKFKEYLDGRNIFCIENYKVGIYDKELDYLKYRYYDFYIPHLNCLVEIHGSYWHPKNEDEVKNEIQSKNFINDKLKRKLAIDNKYFLLTIYDYELDDFMKTNEIIEVEKKLNKKELVYYNSYNGRKPFIKIPEYWFKLTKPDSITVNLTPIGNKTVWVEEINNNKVYINSEDTIDCFYTVFAERKDVDKLVVEVEEN
jgi:hypothetical protein